MVSDDSVVAVASVVVVTAAVVVVVVSVLGPGSVVVVVAACSPSLHELTFRTTLARADLNPYLYDHANIREQVSWVTKSDPEGATDKAIRLVAAAVAKAALQRPLEPLRVEAERHVAVVGGGVAGLTCARDLAHRGLAVSLIERSAALGGRTMDLGRVYPTEEDARGLLRGLVGEVESDPLIRVHRNAEVVAASGSVGSFALTVRTADEERELEVGAIVLATGFDPYIPAHGEFGYGEHAGVITLPDLVRRLGSRLVVGARVRDVELPPVRCQGDVVRDAVRRIRGLANDAVGHGVDRPQCIDSHTR